MTESVGGDIVCEGSCPFMPLDGIKDDIEADFEVLEAIGRHHDGLSLRLFQAGGPQKTIRRWLAGHQSLPDDGATEDAVHFGKRWIDRC